MLKLLLALSAILPQLQAQAAPPVPSIKCVFNGQPRSSLTLTLNRRIGSFFSVTGTAVYFVRIDKLELEKAGDIRSLKSAVIDHWALGQRCEIKVIRGKTFAGCAPYGQYVPMSKIQSCSKSPAI
jgi:hypothetical protein